MHGAYKGSHGRALAYEKVIIPGACHVELKVVGSWQPEPVWTWLRGAVGWSVCDGGDTRLAGAWSTSQHVSRVWVVVGGLDCDTV